MAYATTIRDNNNGAAVNAVVDRLDSQTVTKVGISWEQHRIRLRRSLPANQQPQSLHWQWWNKSTRLVPGAKEALGIIANGSCEGLMFLDFVSHRSRLAVGKDLVYLDYVESAPWNWDIPMLGQTRRFAAVGARLILVALEESNQQGFQGRLGLHSLPQSETYYSGFCDFTKLGPDHLVQNLTYFEADSKQAASFQKRYPL